jgi:hypothetical protein
MSAPIGIGASHLSFQDYLSILSPTQVSQLAPRSKMLQFMYRELTSLYKGLPDSKKMETSEQFFFLNCFLVQQISLSFTYILLCRPSEGSPQ